VDPNFNALLIHVYDIFVCSWIRVFCKSIVLYVSVVAVKLNCDCYVSCISSNLCVTTVIRNICLHYARCACV